MTKKSEKRIITKNMPKMKEEEEDAKIKKYKVCLGNNTTWLRMVRNMTY